MWKAVNRYGLFKKKILSLGSTNLSFLELGELLSDKYHVLSIDLLGHGVTPTFTNDEGYAILNLAGVEML